MSEGRSIRHPQGVTLLFVARANWELVWGEYVVARDRGGEDVGEGECAERSADKRRSRAKIPVAAHAQPGYRGIVG